MALLWIDGFEGYGTSIGSPPSPSGIIGRRYTTVHESIFDIEAGRISGYSLQFNGITRTMRTSALTTDDTVVIGFAFQAYTANAVLVRLYDGATLGVNLRFASGELAIYRGTTQLGVTTTLGLSQSTWYYGELKVKCNDTTGTYEVRLSEVNVLSATGVNTKAGSNNYHDSFMFFGDIIIDDIYFLDSTGSQNNDFLGNVRVIAIRPDGNDSVQWTPSAGDNYAAINEEVCNDDTDYVEDSVAGHKDLYDYESLSLSPSQIFGVQINTMCRETDATPFDLVTVVKSGTTESDDGGQAIGSTDYQVKRRIVELDPDTSSAWTESGVNAAKFGVKVG